MVTITDLGNDIEFAFANGHSNILNKLTLRLKEDDYFVYLTNGSGFINIGSNEVIKIRYSDVTSPVYASNDELVAGIKAMRNTAAPVGGGSVIAPVVLVTASDIGSVDDTWVDQGAEIDCTGYNAVGVYIQYTDNNSSGGQIQVLAKHTTAGSEFKLETDADYQKTLVADDLVAYFFNTQGINYLQLQSKAITVGATKGTITVNITKE